MKKVKGLVKLIFGVCLLAAAFIVWRGAALYQFSHRSAGTNTEQKIIAVLPGEKFNSLATKLEQKGIVANTNDFKLLALIRGDDKRLKAGEFRLTASMTPNQVLDVLVDGRVYLYRLTIPEGYTLKQIAAEVSATGLGQADEFVAVATDPQYAAMLGIKAHTLEGYLFPDTYYFPKGVAAKTIINKMVGHFKEQFSEQWKQRAGELQRSVHEIVTLASIIEKETGAPFERPIIASVFHNRLKKKMRLESDPTVIYAIPNFDGNIKRKHLRTPTPYNTYIIRGLPPGPIANPGLAAMEAALYPDQTNYLFFVSKKDNTHHFSETIEAHRKAVRKYQLRRRKKPPS
jgi:UPF0755 protein